MYPAILISANSQLRYVSGMVMGLAYAQILMGLACEHLLMGQADEHMLMGRGPGP